MKSLEENMEDILDIDVSKEPEKKKQLSNDVAEDREKDYEYTPSLIHI